MKRKNLIRCCLGAGALLAVQPASSHLVRYDEYGNVKETKEWSEVKQNVPRDAWDRKHLDWDRIWGDSEDWHDPGAGNDWDHDDDWNGDSDDGWDSDSDAEWEDDDPIAGNDSDNVYCPPDPPDPSPVPLPPAVWLMGSGLIGLAGIARRRRRK